MEYIELIPAAEAAQYGDDDCNRVLVVQVLVLGTVVAAVQEAEDGITPVAG